jgi:hypothetical protein
MRQERTLSTSAVLFHRAMHVSTAVANAEMATQWWRVLGYDVNVVARWSVTTATASRARNPPPALETRGMLPDPCWELGSLDPRADGPRIRECPRKERAVMTERETHPSMPKPAEQERLPSKKAPKPPKPRKVERRRKGRKG